MVQRIVEDIIKVCDEKVDEIAFVVGRFGKEAEDNLVAVAKSLGAKGSIFYQDTPLGTAHAIMCAESCVTGKVVVAFADTLFKADFKMDSSQEGIIWVQKVEDPKPFGVVKIDADKKRLTKLGQGQTSGIPVDESLARIRKIAGL